MTMEGGEAVVGVIAVISDVLLVREAIADYLGRSRPIRVLSASGETLEDALGTLGRERLAVAVVDLHQVDSAPVALAAADLIRRVRLSCPGVTIVAVGSRVELAAQA